VGQRYVQYTNRMYERTGTLWEGRFKSSIVDRQFYLLSCYRYIELNPVRAGMVSHPREYVWSSYRANAEREHSTVITPHPEYLALSDDVDRRAAAYCTMFAVALDEDRLREIRAAANGGYVLGRREFKATVSATLRRPVEKGSAGRPRKKNQGQTPISAMR
jgi:putative transposase